MKTFVISLVSSVCVIAALVLPQTSRAQAVPVWQTTFPSATCPDWNQGMGRGDADVCSQGDGISGYGGWTANGFSDQITAAANYPGGGGGKGYRHWRGDGKDVNGGSIAIYLPSSYTELWARFYMRYESGFAWSPVGQPLYVKDMYVNVGSSESWVFGIEGGGGRWGIFNGSTGIPSSLTWANTMGGPTGDGQWHCYEWHIQHGSGGRIEIWVDNVQVLNTTTNMTAGPTSYLALGENQHSVAGAGATPWYTDYDDIAFSNTGRIGCLGLPTAMAAPRNLRIQ